MADKDCGSAEPAPVVRLTERQQLARLLSEASPPPLAPRPATAGGARDVSTAGAAQIKKRSRVAKELAALAPWSWDPNVDKHLPGRAMMRDFSQVAAEGLYARTGISAVVPPAKRTKDSERPNDEASNVVSAGDLHTAAKDGVDTPSSPGDDQQHKGREGAKKPPRPQGKRQGRRVSLGAGVGTPGVGTPNPDAEPLPAPASAVQTATPGSVTTAGVNYPMVTTPAAGLAASAQRSVPSAAVHGDVFGSPELPPKRRHRRGSTGPAAALCPPPNAAPPRKPRSQNTKPVEPKAASMVEAGKAPAPPGAARFHAACTTIGAAPTPKVLPMLRPLAKGPTLLGGKPALMHPALANSCRRDDGATSTLSISLLRGVRLLCDADAKC